MFNRTDMASELEVLASVVIIRMDNVRKEIATVDSKLNAFDQKIDAKFDKQRNLIRQSFSIVVGFQFSIFWMVWWNAQSLSYRSAFIDGVVRMSFTAVVWVVFALIMLRILRMNSDN